MASASANDMVTLPSTCAELLKLLHNFGAPDDWTGRNFNIDAMDPKVKALLQFNYPALKIGRPLNKYLILMFGQTGCGKSTTINELFGDNICPTSSSTSETNHVISYSKNLLVTVNDPNIEAWISFVDVPGTLDVNQSREVINFAQIKAYREENESLTSRDKIANEDLPFAVRRKVYPNLVLLVVSATDNRLVGIDSNFQKTLKSLSELDLVDKKYLNLLVIVTSAFYFSPKPNLYSQRTTEFTKIIQESVFSVLHVKNVKVVFVDNKAEDHTDKPDGKDFYELPDGQLSHLNVMKAMEELFKSTGDDLALFLSGWYFDSECPDKNNPVVTDVINYENPIENPRNMVSDFTKLDVNPKDGAGLSTSTPTPAYHFTLLGHGYCPKTETIKHHDLFKEDGLKEIDINGKKFSIPKYMVQICNSGTKFLRQSFENKETYESHRGKEYGFDCGVKLVVNTSAHGKWVNNGRKNERMEHVTCHMVHETCLTSIRIPNIHKYLSGSILRRLINLPETFCAKNSDIFYNFFSRFGTHIIVEQSLGGEISYDCKVRTRDYSEEYGFEIKNRLGLILELIVNGNVDSKTSGKALETLGIQEEILKIRGGVPAAQIMQRMTDLTPEFYLEWKNSIPERPVELEHGFKLIPYYEVLENSTALKKATLEYLAKKEPEPEIFKRNPYARKIVEDAQKSESNWESIVSGIGGLLLVAMCAVGAVVSISKK